MVNKVKVSELSGTALDWAVATIEYADKEISIVENIRSDGFSFRINDTYLYQPSQNWSQGGPIIERKKVNLQWFDGVCEADVSMDCYGVGNTPLEAAMRCYVASKLGDEIEIPKELYDKI